VARRAGVSRATASYALTRPDRVAADTLERVQAAMEELGYVRNNVARQLRVGHSPALGLILSNAANPNFAELAEGAEEEATRHGRFILVANCREDERRERDYIGFFEQQRVSGIIIAPVDEVPDQLVELGQRGTPFVLVGSSSLPHRYPAISGDNEQGGYLATSHLIAQGRRRLAFVGGPHHNVQSRWEGAQRAAGRHAGVHLEAIRVPQQTAQAGEAVARRLLERPRDQMPDGIFTGNDILALGLLHTLIGGGVHVPADVALVGYDDIPFAEIAIVPLTTVRHPSAALGAAAVRLLVGAEPEPVVEPDPRFAPRLIVRDSSLSRTAGVSRKRERDHGMRPPDSWASG
jgi:LacI family transcriptional regulator